MKQEKIKYCDVMALEFNTEVSPDSVYFNEYGYDYEIITKQLTKTIYIDWAKETQLAEMIRSCKKQKDIINRMPIKNLDHMKELINFFTKNKTQVLDYTTCA
jgi:hypothetical protein